MREIEIAKKNAAAESFGWMIRLGNKDYAIDLVQGTPDGCPSGKPGTRFISNNAN
jgi:hypothetical protein